MKLTDLNPRWFRLHEGGDVVGITFDCPHCVERERAYNLRGDCDTQRLGVEFDVGLDLAGTHPGVLVPVPPDGRTHWHRTGDTFDALTITPSIDASNHGHWHGFITNGEIR